MVGVILMTAATENLNKTGVCQTQLRSILCLPFDVRHTHETATLNGALEKLAQRADVFLASLDLEMPGSESAKIVSVAGELARALGLILQGLIFVPVSLAHEKGLPDIKQSGLFDKQASILTSRQLQVLHLLVEGNSNKEIARSLGLGEGTIKVHMAALFRALGVVNRAGEAAVGARLLDQKSSFLHSSGMKQPLEHQESERDAVNLVNAA